MIGRWNRCVFLVCGVVCPLIPHAASFDCAKATAAIEQLICSDQDVSNLDSELGATFSYLLGLRSGQAKTLLVSEQKKWLLDVRNRCDDENCLRAAYLARIDTLRRVQTKKITALYVTSSEARASQAADFQYSLGRFGVPSELTACDLMVEVIDDNGGRDRSFGAICTLDGRTIMVCDDTMVGKLTLKLGGFGITAEDLADFTAANCPRGG